MKKEAFNPKPAGGAGVSQAKGRDTCIESCVKTGGGEEYHIFEEQHVEQRVSCQGQSQRVWRGVILLI